MDGKGLLFCGILFAGLVFSGCGGGSTKADPVFTSSPFIDSSAPAPAPAPETGSTQSFSETGGTRDLEKENFAFQPRDLVVVSFSGSPEPIPIHQERIKEDGNITLPLIGTVKAAGKKPGELQSEIRSRYVPKYYVRLTVTVQDAPGDLYYYVSGEVRAPGPKSYISATTVTKAIAAAGGLTDFARKSKIQLHRADRKTKIIVNWKKAVEDPNADPKVFPGDSIYVPKNWW